MLSVLLKLLIILVLTPRASTRLLAVKLGYLAVYSMNTSVRKLLLADILRDDRPVGECLVEVLKEAARRYSQNGGCAGCMVLKGIHSHDPLARDIAVQYYHAAETTIYDDIAR